MTAAPDRLTVYYDASCPVCAAEMNALAGRVGPGRISLVDCSAPACGADASCPTRDELMRRIHAQRGNGQWLRGVEVFEAVYAMAGYRRLAAIFGSRALRRILDRGYGWIADHRYGLSRLGLPRLLERLLR